MAVPEATNDMQRALDPFEWKVEAYERDYNGPFLIERLAIHDKTGYVRIAIEDLAPIRPADIVRTILAYTRPPLEEEES